MHSLVSTAPRTETIRFITRYDAAGNSHALELDDISNALAETDGSIVWVSLLEPDETLLFKMQVEFDLHPLAIEDAHKAHQRSKIERYGNCLFMVLNTAQLLDDEIRYGESHIFLGARFILTVRHGGSPAHSLARERCERSSVFLQRGPSMLLYSVLDLIVDNFFPIVTRYETLLDDLEESILSAQFKRDTVIHLYRLRNDLTKLRLAVSPLQDILRTLMDFHDDAINSEVRVYLRDVLDHAIRLNESIDTMRETIGSAMATNLSLVTVSQGDTMRRLAGWAALLAVPTLITGWYGMNFQHMPELPTRHGYAMVIAITAGICIIVYRGLKKAGWL
jgi:magnesium transporter